MPVGYERIRLVPKSKVSNMGAVQPYTDHIKQLGGGNSDRNAFMVSASNAPVYYTTQALRTCDGVADEVQIQAAIDSLPSSGGKIILSPGQFNITAPIAYTTSNVIIEGQGVGTVLKLVAASNCNIITVDSTGTAGPNSTRSLAFRNFKIDGNKANQTTAGHGIQLRRVYVPVIENVHFYDCFGTGLYCDDSSNTGWGIQQRILNCYFEGNDYGFYCIYAHAGLLAHCSFYANVTRGFKIHTSSNQFRVVGTEALYTSGGYNFEINATLDTELHSTMFGNSSGSAGYAEGCRRLRIIGGGVADNVDPVDGEGLRLNDCHESSLIGMVAKACGKEGLVIVNCTKIVVDGGKFDDNSYGNANVYSDIKIAGLNTRDISVLNSIFTAGNAACGVEEHTDLADAVRTRIRGNIFSGHDTSATYLRKSTSTTGEVVQDMFMDVLAATATHLLNAENVSAYAGGETPAIVAQPDVPRNITVTSVDAAAGAPVLTTSVIITGKDAKGNTVTETITTSGSETKLGAVAFASVTSQEVDVIAGNGVGDTLSIGIGEILGLSNKINATSDVIKIKKNNANATVATAQVNAVNATYNMSVITLAATDDFTIWYRNNLNTML
uniref:Putative pectate lyase n=1 Tax=viral metagenome TaxID=1070528 RepID=A0A6H1ZFD6_9ZZZZ